MKKYTTPTLNVVQLEDKDTITMANNNIKTFNASNLADSCGYADLLADVFNGDQALLDMVPIDQLPGLINLQGDFELVAS